MHKEADVKHYRQSKSTTNTFACDQKADVIITQIHRCLQTSHPKEYEKNQLNECEKKGHPFKIPSFFHPYYSKKHG